MSCKLKKTTYLLNILLKYSYYYNLYFLIFIISCTKDQNLILTNTVTSLPNKINDLNLHSLNSGQNLESVTIRWNKKENSTIKINGNVKDSSETFTFNNLNAGEFSDIIFELENEEEYYKDSIQIYTRSVHPVTNFTFIINEELRGNLIFDEGESWTDLDSNGTWGSGEEFIDKKYKQYHRLLLWQPTLETNDNFEKYIIYRSEDPALLIATNECNCAIANLESIIDSSYIDSSIEVIEEKNIKTFYYRIQVASKNASQNSYIYNYTSFNSPSKIQLDNSNNNSYDGYIIINWEPVINSNLNHYEIWRSKDEQNTGLHLITSINDPTIDHFMDRNVGNGATWFYSLAVVDITGRKKFSDYIEKWSKP